MAAPGVRDRARLCAPSRRPIAAEEPSFDPLKASKDIEIGKFYMKRGNYDAAIDRFQEAARLQPGLAEPYMKLGQTYEKMKDLPHAVTAYRKYLEVYRTSPDARRYRSISMIWKSRSRESLRLRKPVEIAARAGVVRELLFFP